MSDPAYNRQAMNRKLHAVLGQIGRAGADADAVKADLVHQVSGGRTVHSSELDDHEHRRLVSLIVSRAPETIASSETGKQEGRRYPKAARLDADRFALPTAAQKGVIGQLAQRVGFDDEKLQMWCHRALRFYRPTSRGQAHMVIEALKSQVIQNLDLRARCSRILMMEEEGLVSLTDRQRTVLGHVAVFATGRSKNKIPAGGVLWAADLCNSYLENSRKNTITEFSRNTKSTTR